MATLITDYKGGLRGRDRMVVSFMITITTNVSTNPAHGEVY